MRILHIVPSYKPAYVYGGPIESVAKLCEALIQQGQEVHVYTTTANGTTELAVEPNKTKMVDGVPVTYFARVTKDHSHLSPRLWKTLYRTCRSFDIVHIHSWWNPLVMVAALICQARKVKVIVSPRGMLSQYIIYSSNSGIKKLVHTLAGGRILKKTRFHATSQIEFKECSQLIPGWQGFMIPNLITLPQIPIKKSGNNLFTLLFLSRIHPKKGIEFLIEALPSLPNMILKIAGSGDEDYIHKLKQNIKALQVENRVQWIASKDRQEKFTELMKADLFVLISYNENFANSVIESLHMGTPVLVSNMVGIAPFVEAERMGWVTGLSSKEVTDKLKTIINEIPELQRIQRDSRSVVDAAFSEQKLIRQYIEQYQSFLFS